MRLRLQIAQSKDRVTLILTRCFSITRCNHWHLTLVQSFTFYRKNLLLNSRPTPKKSYISLTYGVTIDIESPTQILRSRYGSGKMHKTIIYWKIFVYRLQRLRTYVWFFLLKYQPCLYLTPLLSSCEVFKKSSFFPEVQKIKYKYWNREGKNLTKEKTSIDPIYTLHNMAMLNLLNI